MTAFPLRAALALVTLCLACATAQAEDGYDLWLRYKPVEKQYLAPYRAAATALVTAGTSDSTAVARATNWSAA